MTSWGILQNKNVLSNSQTVKTKQGIGTKGRSGSTYNNKINKLKQLYNRLYKASLKAKEKGKARRFYFHEKYPTFDKFKETVKMKEVNSR